MIDEIGMHQSEKRQYGDASNLNARLQLHECFSTNKYGWHRWVFDQLGLTSKRDILELGCGTGDLWQKNADRIPTGWNITLTDVEVSMVNEAKRHLCKVNHPFRFAVFDAQSIPLDAESVDVVIANHMLYHVSDKHKVFSEISRVLRPAGLFFASSIGRNHMRELYELVHRFDPSFDPWSRRFGKSFLLENGHKQISRWFPKVMLRRYEDSLIINETEPLLAYVMSTDLKSIFNSQTLKEFKKFIENELALHNSVYVTKDSGLFQACKE
jgi:ubiquinone/menaquinone biosynthesis C-methylase UbiE